MRDTCAPTCIGPYVQAKCLHVPTTFSQTSANCHVQMCAGDGGQSTFCGFCGPANPQIAIHPCFSARFSSSQPKGIRKANRCLFHGVRLAVCCVPPFATRLHPFNLSARAPTRGSVCRDGWDFQIQTELKSLRFVHVHCDRDWGATHAVASLTL